ncbi:MAG: hypothetical protein RML38_07495 [Bacteroidia bacterium]|nr:hypothetical protein [Bacteroidia bacterium]
MKSTKLLLSVLLLWSASITSIAQGYDEMYGDYYTNKPRGNSANNSYSYSSEPNRSEYNEDSYEYDAFIEEDGYYTSRLRRFYGDWWSGCSYYDPFYTNSWYWGWGMPTFAVVTTPTIWGGWRTRIIWSYGWGWSTYYYNPFLYTSVWNYNPWWYGFYNPFSPWNNPYMAGYMAGYYAGYNAGFYNGWWGNPYYGWGNPWWGWGYYNPYVWNGGWNDPWGWRNAPRNSSGGMVTNNSGRGSSNVTNLNPGRVDQSGGNSPGRSSIISSPRNNDYNSNPRPNYYNNNTSTPRPNYYNNSSNNNISKPRGSELNNNTTPRSYENNNPTPRNSTPRNYENNIQYNATPRNFNNSSNFTPRSYTPSNSINSGNRSSSGSGRYSPR